MNITVNGKKQTFDNEKLTVNEVLQRENVEQPEMVSIQLNGEFLNKEAYNNTTLADNDQIDFLYFMGGGK